MKIDTVGRGRWELHDLIGNSLSPLPIAFVSTVSRDGISNVAPYSFAAPVNSSPPIICISIGERKGQKKTTLKNIEATGDFVINVVDEKLIKKAVESSGEFPAGTDKLKALGLKGLPGEKVKALRIAESKVSLECRLYKTVNLTEESASRVIIFGEVIFMHIADEVYVDGNIDPRKLKAIGRLGRGLYCRTTDILEIPNPK